ncbi:MAG: hypothetical protein HYT68_00370 [Candidatus Zambryskibacteria bacterium]|nr:hypothetical protein [Candidatus Zambryskibacteria bacterium]
MVFFLSISYFSTLFFFGWQVSRSILNENRFEYLITFAGIFGIGLYVFFINIMGLFIPIQTVFYLVLLVFLLFASTCFLARRLQIFGDQRSLEWSVSAPWRKALLFSVLFLTLSVGLISFRHPMDRASTREPTAATIAEGNFPPVEIFNPTDPLHYHYAPDLFAAATHKTTGLPLYLAYDLERAILSGVLFLFGFLLVLLFFPGQFFVAFFSSVSMMYAGSLVFFNTFSGIPVLSRLILGQSISAPFKFVSDAIIGIYTTPVINSVVNMHWGAMALALTLAVTYLYFYLLNGEKEGRRMTAFFAVGFIFALLALVSEPYFVVLSVVIFLFPFVSIFKKDQMNVKRIFATSFFLLAIALPVAFFQGGLLRPAVVQQLYPPAVGKAYDSILYTSNPTSNQTHSFRIGTPWLLYDGKPVSDPRFLAEFILLLAVLVPALFFLFKQRFQLALFLTSLLLLFFFIPLFVASDLPDLATQLVKFFNPVPLFGGLVAGWFLTTSYLRAQKTPLKGFLLFLALVFMAQGLWTHAVWLAFGNPPGGIWNPNAKIFAQVDTPEAVAYTWIKKNTAADDLFLIIKDNHFDCGVYGTPNCLFVFNTGRMAPTFTIESNTEIAVAGASSQDKATLFSEVSKNCDSGILQELRYHYLYVDDQWSKGMEAMCIKKNELNLVFQIREGEKFIRIYKIQ